MLEGLYAILGILIWVIAPILYLIIFSYYRKEKIAFRIVLWLTLSVISVMGLFFAKALVLAELMLRNNPF